MLKNGNGQLTYRERLENYVHGLLRTYLAYIISRHPAGLTLEQIKQLTRPRYIMVAAIGLA